MPIHRRHPFSRPRHQPRFWSIYVLSVLFTFHGLLVAYSNSTYLEQYITPSVIGILYSVASVLAVLLFLASSHILNKIGNTALTLILVLLGVLSLGLIGIALAPLIIIVAFVIFLTISPLIYLNIDIYSESLIGEAEGSTGSKRGLTLTLMSLAAVFAPLCLSFLVGTDDTNLYKTYFVSAGVFVLFGALVFYFFHDFADSTYQEFKLVAGVKQFWQSVDVRNVFLAHLTLQIFFAWMIVYFPLYLAIEVGLSWESIGSIIAVGLIAYVVFEYPVGIIADKFFGEQEMMALGFVILALASAAIAYAADFSVIGWMTLMFVSRIGAALVEVTTESYFFKHTKGSDANIISFFRLTRPLAMIIGALVGSITLFFVPFELMFVILGCMMVPGVFFTRKLHDTK